MDQTVESIYELAATQIYELSPLEMVNAKDLGVGQGYSVLRVPGGWIFIWLDTSCFVPFDNEFHISEKGREHVPDKKAKTPVPPKKKPTRKPSRTVSTDKPHK